MTHLEACRQARLAFEALEAKSDPKTEEAWQHYLSILTGQHMDFNKALDYAVAYVGGTTKLCDLLGIKRQAIYYWKKRGRVPLARVLEIERLTNGSVKKEWLYPNFF